jgi:hypothetical protein
MAGTLVANVINQDTGLFSTNNAYSGIAKAWVNFQGGNGNTAGTINSSFNVSSITVNGTGDYTVNFITAMPNANYVGIGTTNSAGASNANQICCAVYVPTTTAFRVNTVYGVNNTLYNMYAVYMAFFA